MIRDRGLVPDLGPAEQRRRIEQHAARGGWSYVTLSRVLRKNPGYIARFLAGGSPRSLPVEDRGRLARFMGASERELGAPVTLRAARRIPIYQDRHAMRSWRRETGEWDG